MSNDKAPKAPPGDSRDVTRLLVRWSQGDHSVLEELAPLIYGDLLRVARARLRHEPGECTLEPTALVHEAYLRLADQKNLHAENRVHFYQNLPGDRPVQLIDVRSPAEWLKGHLPGAISMPCSQ
jgi:ECF sigma factor/Rhodanese-like domain